jgi:hypothetical protein
MQQPPAVASSSEAAPAPSQNTGFRSQVSSLNPSERILPYVNFEQREQNRSLSYLPRLADEGIQLSEISRSGHFPMYSNPVEMWCRITDFILGTGQ